MVWIFGVNPQVRCLLLTCMAFINFHFHLYFINMLWVFIQISSSGSESAEKLTQSWLFCSQCGYQTSSETYLKRWISKADRNDRIILSGPVKPGKCNWRQKKPFDASCIQDIQWCNYLLSAPKHDLLVTVVWVWNTEHGWDSMCSLVWGLQHLSWQSSYRLSLRI